MDGKNAVQVSEIVYILALSKVVSNRGGAAPLGVVSFFWGCWESFWYKFKNFSSFYFAYGPLSVVANITGSHGKNDSLLFRSKLL